MMTRAWKTSILPALALLLLGWGTSLHASEVRGHVADPAGEPAARVLVSIPELALTAVSDQQGAFVLSGVPDGTYVLLCEGAGLVPIRLPVTVPTESPLEIVVMSATSIKKGGEGELEEDQAARAQDEDFGGPDAGGVKVQLLCTNCNAASLSMLGLQDEHVDISMDGIPIVEGIEAIWALSMLPPASMAKSEIVPGPGSVFSGPAGLGGRMELVSVDPMEAGPGGRFELHRGSNDLWAETLYGRGKITENLYADAVVTHSTSDGISPNKDDRMEQGAIDRETVFARLYYKFSERSRLRIGMHAYHEDQWGAPGAYSVLEDGWLEEIVPIKRRSIHAAWEYNWDNGTYLKASTMFSNRDQVLEEELVDFFGNGGDPEYDLIYDIDAKHEYANIQAGGFLGSRWLLEGGVDYNLEVLDVFDPGQLSGENRVTDVVEHLGAYIQGTVNLPHRVDLLVGARYDDFNEFGADFLPRVGLRWKPADGVYVSMGVGESYRPPYPVFEEVCCGNRYQSNTELNSESGWAGHMSLAWYPTQRAKVTVAGLYSEFDDFILHLESGHAGLNSVYRNENVSEVTIKGTELGFQYRLERLSFGGSIGFVDSDFEGEVIAPIPQTAGGGEYAVLGEDVGRLPYVTEDTGSLYVTWTGSLWNANLQADYFGSQWIQVKDDENLAGGIMLPELRSTPSYWSVNARASRKVGTVELYAGVDNALDEYQDDFDDRLTSAKWGLQRGRYIYAGVGWDF